MEGGVAQSEELGMTVDEKRKALADYLAGARHWLFNASVKSMSWLRDTDLDTLMMEGGSCRSAIRHIREFEGSGERFTSVAGLFQALSIARVMSAQRKQE